MARVISIRKKRNFSGRSPKSLLWVSLAYGFALSFGLGLGNSQTLWVRTLENRLALHLDWVFLSTISTHSFSLFLLQVFSNLGMGLGQFIAGYFFPIGVALGMFHGFACGLLLRQLAAMYFLGPFSSGVIIGAVFFQSASTILFLGAGIDLGLGVWSRYRSGDNLWFRVEPISWKNTVKVCGIASVLNLLSSATALLLPL